MEYSYCIDATREANVTHPRAKNVVRESFLLFCLGRHLLLLGLLRFVILHRSLDGIFRQHAAMQLDGGSFKWAAISEFLMAKISSTDFPLTHSVATELLAMAEPQPNVLNLESMIVPFSSTRICNFITSPQAGAPTRPCS